MEYLKSLTDLIGNLLKINILMLVLTQDEKQNVSNATHCEFCDTEMSIMYQPILDHCHLSGKCKSILHNNVI